MCLKPPLGDSPVDGIVPGQVERGEIELLTERDLDDPGSGRHTVMPIKQVDVADHQVHTALA